MVIRKISTSHKAPSSCVVRTVAVKTGAFGHVQRDMNATPPNGVFHLIRGRRTRQSVMDPLFRGTWPRWGDTAW